MNPIVAFAITEALQYGPTFVKSVIAAFSNPATTVGDIDKLFMGVKPYSAYNIPDIAPTTTTTTGVTLPSAN